MGGRWLRFTPNEVTASNHPPLAFQLNENGTATVGQYATGDGPRGRAVRTRDTPRTAVATGFNYGHHRQHDLLSELAARFDKLVTIYPVKRSALVPMLLYAQDEVGYVSDEVITELAQRLDLLELDVRNVLSYYSMFAPPGRPLQRAGVHEHLLHAARRL